MLYPSLNCGNLLHSTCFGGWPILYFPSLASESRSDVVVVQSKGRSSFSQTTAVCHLTGSVTRAHGLRFAVVCINAKLHLMFAKRTTNSSNMNDSISLGVRMAILLLVGWNPFAFKTWCWTARRLEFSGSEKVGISTCWGRDHTILPKVVFSFEKKNYASTSKKIWSYRG